MLLCVSVGGARLVRGLGGLEEAWGWDGDDPACDNLMTGGKWQIQNVVMRSRRQVKTRDSKQGRHTSLVSRRGHSMSRQDGQGRSKGSMWASSPPSTAMGLLNFCMGRRIKSDFLRQKKKHGLLKLILLNGKLA